MVCWRQKLAKNIFQIIRNHLQNDFFSNKKYTVICRIQTQKYRNSGKNRPKFTAALKNRPKAPNSKQLMILLMLRLHYTDPFGIWPPKVDMLFIYRYAIYSLLCDIKAEFTNGMQMLLSDCCVQPKPLC